MLSMPDNDVWKRRNMFRKLRNVLKFLKKIEILVPVLSKTKKYNILISQPT